MKRAASALLLSILILPGVCFAGKAATRQEIIRKEKKLEDVKKQIREEKKSVKTFVEKETTILGELENINKNLVEKRDELKKAESSLASIQREVSRTGTNIARLEKEKKALNDRIRQRLRAMYKMKKGAAVKALFSSESSKDLGRRHKYLTIVMDSDSNLITGYERNISRLDSERKRLEVLSRSFTEARQAALVKKNEAEALQREKTALLTDVKGEREKRLRILKELEQAESELSDLLNRLRVQEKPPEEPAGGGPVSGFAAMKGRLQMPVEGMVVSSYGKVKHPKFQTVTFNNGIVIEAPSGTPARNIYEGRVLYVGWLKGYGQVMIIDHGGGFYTLFAHLSKVLKERGEIVRKGDEVGLVGDTGASASPGLYFEIRQKGVPRDPMAWFAEK